MLKPRFRPRNLSRACVSRGASAAPRRRARRSMNQPTVRASQSGTEREGRATLGFDLGLGVTVHVLVGKRFGLVGAVVMAGRVNAEAAQMHEAQQRLVLAGLQQGSQGIDVDRAVIFNRPPITDLRGAMNHDL